jgi:hypothetical protein
MRDISVALDEATWVAVVWYCNQYLPSGLYVLIEEL